MTAKKGSLWKTSWKRSGVSPPAPILGDMLFFQDFALGADIARYSTSPNPSSLGLTLPYWFAQVGLRSGHASNNIPGYTNFSANSDTDEVNAGALIGFGPAGLTLSVPGDDNLSAAIVVVRPYVTPGPPATFYQVLVVLDDQVSQTFTRLVPYTPPTDPLSIQPGQLPGAIHGLAGGPYDLTPDEIHQWFTDLKANLAIQPIPGKTSHLYSAASVVGVPAVLPNGGSAGAAQDMNLSVTGAPPAPQNSPIPVRVPW